MSPRRRPLPRAFAIAAATAVLVTLCATVPAHAAARAGDGGDGDDPAYGRFDDPVTLPGTGNTGDPDNNDLGRYRGIVTAPDGIWLLDQPERGSRRIRFVDRGAEVSILCRAVGDPVDGDRVWYVITDGTWAWGPARSIDTGGRTPRWC
ncbi:SH3 domain-containing protein [Streptomyces sp. NPDC048277]|uniref:SH3 domain-containing protein n=1 Tax=Streptomyces sp. NPDC048277 TaxID=3155027 RepID=UPI0033DAC631